MLGANDTSRRGLSGIAMDRPSMSGTTAAAATVAVADRTHQHNPKRSRLSRQPFDLKILKWLTRPPKSQTPQSVHDG